MPRHDGTFKTLLRSKSLLSSKMHKSGMIALAALLILMTTIPPAYATESPSPRHGARMIYDPVNQRVLLFGGAKFDNRYTFYNDMWAFDTASRGWARVEAPIGPQGRLNHNMAYDTDRHQIILFGGFGGSDRMGDTWIYDIAENEWTRISANPSPTPRSDAGFVYDEAHGVAILFGGYGLNDSHPDDTWVFDPDTGTWAQMNPQVSPPAMYGCMMVYDRSNQALLLHGGHWSSRTQSGVHGYISSVWVYDLDEDTWTEVQATSEPSGRYWHMMAYDSSRGEFLIYGGYAGSDSMSDAWTYDCSVNVWTRVAQDGGPGPRANTWIVYDETNDAYVLFGGLGLGFQVSGLKGDTWILRLEGDHGTWVQVGLEPAAEPPPSCIPGYPLAALAISLSVAVWVMRRRAGLAGPSKSPWFSWGLQGREPPPPRAGPRASSPPRSL